MSAARPLGWAAAAALAALLVAVAAAFDDALAAAARGAPRALVLLGRFITDFGTSEYMFAYSGLIFAVAVVALGRGHAEWHGGSLGRIAERSLYVFAVIAASGLVDQALKHLIGRARPVLRAVEGPFSFHPLSLPNALASFPSGHTTSAFAAAVALGYMRPDWRVRLLAAAALIGASRVLVGAHYPSDVAAGAMLGSAAAVALARGFARRGIAFAAAEAGRAVLKPLRPAARSTNP